MDSPSPTSDAASSGSSGSQPFGAGVGAPAGGARPGRNKNKRRRGKKSRAARPDGEGGGAPQGGGGGQNGAASSGSGGGQGGGQNQGGGSGGDSSNKQGRSRRRGQQKTRRGGRRRSRSGEGEGGGEAAGQTKQGGPKKQGGQAKPSHAKQGGGAKGAPESSGEVTGMIVLDKGNHGQLRLPENQFLPSKRDVHVAPRFVQKWGLRDGALVRGRYGKGHGKHKFDLTEVLEVDGQEPGALKKTADFKSLTSIDPDFHYEVGDPSGDVSMRVLDIICPVGRGQRGLIVAPPRSGKTILLQQFAKTIEATYPDVHLMVLLVDERPEEATEWKRSIEHGEVFVSTNDELAKTHVELAEAVWHRCKRLVELGEDVILLLDSITRLARAYNHVHGSSGKTMSGGLDSRAMERPRMIFGSARNTETAGSLTILGTTLIETGSRMDQMIFEEFKGTGNMELVLSRKLADRRIFPAIDVERSGTRKEEKILGSRRIKWVHVLRRVLSRMHFAEAMELLITRVQDVEKTDDFLKRFEIDPDA